MMPDLSKITREQLADAFKKMRPVIQRGNARAKTNEPAGKFIDVLATYNDMVDDNRRCWESDEVQTVIKALNDDR